MPEISAVQTLDSLQDIDLPLAPELVTGFPWPSVWLGLGALFVLLWIFYGLKRTHIGQAIRRLARLKQRLASNPLLSEEELRMQAMRLYAICQNWPHCAFKSELEAVCFGQKSVSHETLIIWQKMAKVCFWQIVLKRKPNV